MRLLALFALCFASLAIVGVFAFAIAGMPAAAIAAGCSVPLGLLIASREADAHRLNAEWRDARRHPRL